MMDSNLQPKTSTVEGLLQWAVQVLDGGDSPSLDARILLAHSLAKSTTFLMTWPEHQVDNQPLLNFIELINQRASGTPIAHLIGYRDFWTLRLAVNEHTLIPRPETELLVESVLALTLPQETQLLDLGTGTGAIALSLAWENPSWQISAVDLVPEAIELAKMNAKNHQLNHVNFYQSCWFEKVDQSNFDIIVSNPPYVESASEYLSQGDVRFEPLSALTSGEDGLEDIRHIGAHAQRYLNPNGVLVLEHGYNQAEAIALLLKGYGYQNIESRLDLNGHARVTIARWGALT